MGKEKKAFKDTLFGKIVSKAGSIVQDIPKVVGQVASGNYLGAIATVAGDLAKSDNPEAPIILNELTLKMAAIEVELAKIELEEFTVAQVNTTKRWEADMHSDSWLSKNIRPLGMSWVLVMTTVLLILAWFKVETPEVVLMMFGGLATSITGGYYVLRTVEKRNTKKYK
tara:strand:- start:170 stop:676 length:507 start_codon:yes stop_codon:yes gene_type:complete